MRLLSCLLFIGISILFSFSQGRDANELNSPKDGVVVSTDYDSLKLTASQKRDALLVSYKAAKSDSARKMILKEANRFLYNLLTTQVFPNWYGTTWDFNGTSEVPGKGEIACGYFVSTTLRDVGFRMNRYRLAQQYSLKIVQLMCGPKSINRIGHGKVDEVIREIERQDHNIYIVGLDNHVGFLIKENGKVWFTHSSYLDPVAVAKEKAIDSPALNASDNYVFGSVLTDEVLVKWLNGYNFTSGL